MKYKQKRNWKSIICTMVACLMLFAMLPANALANTSMLSPQVISVPMSGSDVSDILAAGDDVDIIAGGIITGTIFVPVGRILTLAGGTVSGGTNSGVNVNGGTFIMQSGTISGNTAPTWGGGVHVHNGGSFTMNNGTITENTSNSHGGGVTVRNANATFEMHGGTIVGNTVSGRGGGVHIVGAATFNMYDGIIEANNATNGGGVNVESVDATFSMTGGYIRNHTNSPAGTPVTTRHGGGVNNSGSFTMTGGTIYNNTAGRGGGVSLQGTGNTFTLGSGAVIRDNIANVEGGGVAAYQSTFLMNAGIIRDNNSNGNGGGVWISQSSVTINGGTIYNNEAATVGGGISLQNHAAASLTINGGTVSGNTAADGGGVGFVMSGPNPTVAQFQNFLTIITIGNNATFTGNTATTGQRVHEGLRAANTQIAPATVSFTPPGHAFTNHDVHMPPMITVTFISGPNGTIAPAPPVNVWVIEGEHLTSGQIPNPVPDTGYQFDGWFYNGVLVPDLLVVYINGPMTFEARFVPISQGPIYHDVTFDLDGGVYDGDQNLLLQTIIEGNNAQGLSENPSRIGYSFAGWYPTLNLINVTENRTFVAQWDELYHTVRFLWNYTGAPSGGVFLEVQVRDGQQVSVPTPAPQRTGYNFNGWYTSATGGTAFNFATLIRANTVLYARWAVPTPPGPGPGQGGPGPGPGPGGSGQTPQQPQDPTPPADDNDNDNDDDNDNENGNEVLIPIDPTPVIYTHYAYMIGFEDGTVRPQANITRAEATTIFFRLISDTHRSGIWSRDNGFNDVALTGWYNTAISTMDNGGFVAGYPDGSFRPNQSITRAEMTALVVRFMGYGHLTDVQGNTFSDAQGHWAQDAITVASRRGWVTGFEDGTFRPDQPITRAEAAALVNRMLGRLPQNSDDLLDDMLTWPDNMNVNAWYYLYIQEATNSHYHVMKADGIHETWTELIEPRDWRSLEVLD